MMSIAVATARRFSADAAPEDAELAAEIGLAKRLDVADQIIDLCPCQRQIRHRTVRMR